MRCREINCIRIIVSGRVVRCIRVVDVRRREIICIRIIVSGRVVGPNVLREDSGRLHAMLLLLLVVVVEGLLLLLLISNVLRVVGRAQIVAANTNSLQSLDSVILQCHFIIIF